MLYARSVVALVIWLALSSSSAEAGGGVNMASPIHEISQSCVDQGCFAGDAPGFPVTANESGVYRVVSDLHLGDVAPNLVQTLIDIGPGTSDSSVVLDLQQHSLIGNGDERYGGCLVRLSAGDVTLVNGAIRHGGGHGVCADVWQSLLVEHVSSTHHAAHGLKVLTGTDAATTLRQVVLAQNGFSGFEHEHKRAPGNSPWNAGINLTFVFNESQFIGNSAAGIHIVEGSARLQDNHFVGNGGAAARMEDSVYTFFGGNSAHMNGGHPTNAQFVVLSPDRRIALANNACVNCFGP